MSKFMYYNIVLAVVFYAIFYLYQINFWLAIVGGIVIMILFVKITAKVMKK